MKIKQQITFAYHDTKQCILHIVRRMWLVSIKQKWNRLFIRKDEFSKTLDMDGEALSYMNDTERKKYMVDLVKRRNIAHERDFD